MTPTLSTQEVFTAIQQTKEDATAYCTNFYPVQEKVERWISDRSLYIQRHQHVTFLFRKDRDFWHLYFCARDKNALQIGLSNLEELRSERMVTDILGNSAAVTTLLPLVRAAGLRPYKQLFRMARVTRDGMVSSSATASEAPIVFAKREDTRTILDLIEAAFDQYAKQIPSTSEIASAADARQILTLRHGTELAGLLFFDTRGVTSTLRFWAVTERFRDLGVGSALMRRYLASQCGVQRFVLWVNTDNEDAVRKYQHYHYATDGVVDHVFANECITK